VFDWEGRGAADFGRRTGKSTLVIVRGNSGSGKTAIATAVQRRLGRGVAARVGQDQLRREILRERDVAGGLAPAFICHTVDYLLERMPIVLLEGILASSRYGASLKTLADRHSGQTLAYWLDVDFAETLKRHRNRPWADNVTAEEMAGWYTPDDRLGLPGEYVIPQSISLEQAVELICEHISHAIVS
jgi:predicted kinase